MLQPDLTIVWIHLNMADRNSRINEERVEHARHIRNNEGGMKLKRSSCHH